VAASKGWMTWFLSTTKSAIARSPFGIDAYLRVWSIRRTIFLPRSFFSS
jgi:hypothetical protein